MAQVAAVHQDPEQGQGKACQHPQHRRNLGQKAVNRSQQAIQEPAKQGQSQEQEQQVSSQQGSPAEDHLLDAEVQQAKGVEPAQQGHHATHGAHFQKAQP
jgi:hypothetical protein